MLFDKTTSVTTPALVTAGGQLATSSARPPKSFGGAGPTSSSSTGAASVSAFSPASLSPSTHRCTRSATRNILQTLAVQEIVARQAISMAPGLPLHVGPVTLRQRFNPWPPRSASANEPETDPRQNTMWAACWAFGSVSALARAGASALPTSNGGPAGSDGQRRGQLVRTLSLYPVYEVFQSPGPSSSVQLGAPETTDDTLWPSLALLATARSPTVLVRQPPPQHDRVQVDGTASASPTNRSTSPRPERVGARTGAFAQRGRPVAGTVQLQPHEIAVITGPPGITGRPHAPLRAGPQPYQGLPDRKPAVDEDYLPAYVRRRPGQREGWR